MRGAVGIRSQKTYFMWRGEGRTAMNDLISRQAAIDAMEQAKEQYFDRRVIIGKMQDVVSNLPSAQSEPRWIPCSERLPDIGGHHVSDPCIVYCSNGAYGFAELEENIFGQVGWNCERDDEYHEPLGEVLAWMPLPEPYQEEGEKDGKDT